jgi:hypothetical protein
MYGRPEYQKTFRNKRNFFAWERYATDVIVVSDNIHGELENVTEPERPAEPARRPRRPARWWWSAKARPAKSGPAKSAAKPKARSGRTAGRTTETRCLKIRPYNASPGANAGGFFYASRPRFALNHPGWPNLAGLGNVLQYLPRHAWQLGSLAAWQCSPR